MVSAEESGAVEWPPGPVPPILIVGLLSLAQAAHGPSIPALEFLDRWTVSLFGSKTKTQYVLYAAVGAHVLEGVAAFVIARKAGYQWKASFGWWMQTTLLGFPSLRILSLRIAAGPKRKTL
ncbi:hypothetical protein FVE85_0415 [Porphyridium purpureum]|uniref:Uncharacterized protein n=1 Tax=Porphyridium purpureum TaxID=35688 RepID=A0A5J4YZE0_PORPP|nr:hypothetical protein FVE85_0415 [Porphyridium purpureum]|eukprot:POR3453..scf208_2